MVQARNVRRTRLCRVGADCHCRAHLRGPMLPLALDVENRVGAQAESLSEEAPYPLPRNDCT